jgi:hypothetical protein
MRVALELLNRERIDGLCDIRGGSGPNCVYNCFQMYIPSAFCVRVGRIVIANHFCVLSVLFLFLRTPLSVIQRFENRFSLIESYSVLLGFCPLE